MNSLYTQMKIFHFKEKVDSLPKSITTILSPIQIRIKPTNMCNHNCSYCAYRVDGLQLGKDMVIKDQIPREKIIEIMEDIIEMGVKSVAFSGGGEPFCYPYLLDTVKKLSKTDVRFAALTNGAKLTGEIAEIFARFATWLRVSIDGWDEKSYAQYRGVGEAEFKKVMNNMEDFKKIGGKCYLGVSLVVDKSNSTHVYELVKNLKNIGVNSVKVSPCIVSNNGMDNDEYHAAFFQSAKNQIRKAIEDLSEDKFEIFDAYHKLDEEFNKKYAWCPYLQILPVIGADLNIYPCQDKAYNLDDGLIGSIKDIRFKDFWFSNKSNFFRINPSIHCNHRCVADKKNRLILDYLGADKEHLVFV